MVNFIVPTLPIQENINQRLLYLNTALKDIIGNDLGQYQLIKGAKVVAVTPAIRTHPPVLDTEFKMVPKSGIECIINRSVDIQTETALSNGQSVFENYSIQLRQFDPSKSTQGVVLRIIGDKRFQVFESPRIVPYTELSTGIVFEACTLRIIVGNWYLKN